MIWLIQAAEFVLLQQAETVKLFCVSYCVCRKMVHCNIFVFIVFAFANSDVYGVRVLYHSKASSTKVTSGPANVSLYQRAPSSSQCLTRKNSSEKPMLPFTKVLHGNAFVSFYLGAPRPMSPSQATTGTFYRSAPWSSQCLLLKSSSSCQWHLLPKCSMVKSISATKELLKVANGTFNYIALWSSHISY